MFVNLLQPSKARASMLDIPSGKRISVKLIQLEKAEFPMIVTLSGMITLLSAVQFSNVQPAIPTVSGKISICVAVSSQSTAHFPAYFMVVV